MGENVSMVACAANMDNVYVPLDTKANSVKNVSIFSFTFQRLLIVPKTITCGGEFNTCTLSIF